MHCGNLAGSTTKGSSCSNKKSPGAKPGPVWRTTKGERRQALLSCAHYHVVLHTRKPKMWFSILFRLVRVTPNRADIPASCLRQESTLMHGTNTDSPNSIASHGTTMRIPSGCKSLIRKTIRRLKIDRNFENIDGRQVHLGPLGQAYLGLLPGAACLQVVQHR